MWPDVGSARGRCYAIAAESVGVMPVWVWGGESGWRSLVGGSCSAWRRSASSRSPAGGLAEGAFNEVGVPDALPVLAREPQVDRQRVAVGEQTAHRRRVGLAPTCGERIDAVLGDGHRLEPGRDAVGEIE